MEDGYFKQTLENAINLGKLSQVMSFKVWMNKQINELPPIAGVDEFGYCENFAKRELLNKLEEFIHEEVEHLKKVVGNEKD